MASGMSTGGIHTATVKDTSVVVEIKSLCDYVLYSGQHVFTVPVPLRPHEGRWSYIYISTLTANSAKGLCSIYWGHDGKAYIEWYSTEGSRWINGTGYSMVLP